MFKKTYSAQSPVKFGDIFPEKIGSKDTLSYMLDRGLDRPRDIMAYIKLVLNTPPGVMTYHRTSCVT